MRHRRWGTLLFLALTAGCGSGAIYHQVRPGENLYRIGKAYGVSYRAIAQANDLRDPSSIRPGQRLRIPGASSAVPVDLVTPREASARAPRADERSAGEPRFHWPLPDSTVTSAFGERNGGFHDGIDIAAPVGALVRAAADGEVVYSAILAGYGNVIILRHADGYATVYAHNERNRVGEGDRVRAGQVIATVGRSGRTSAPNLHFEVRKDNVARNPVFYLPPSVQAEQRAAFGGG